MTGVARQTPDLPVHRIRTYNKIAQKGLMRFDRSYIVGENLDAPDAIVLRSQKLHNEVLPESVIAVARAGAGTNNIPIEACSKRGIVVFNTPGANANAVKELVLAGLLLSSRGILEGQHYVRSLGRIDDAAELARLLEAEKKRFAGSELAGKKLGVVGLGAIGSMVADAALALGMDVLGYDPALSVEAAWRLSSEVRRMENLEGLLAEADYLSLHVPALPTTRHMIDRDALALMKPDAAIMNFSRAEIVDPQAIVGALDGHRLRRYVSDFPEPCLIGHAGAICMPHIGASTAEAEENCAVMAVDQLRDYLKNGNIRNSVNFPQTRMSRGPELFRVTFTNRNVSGVLGRVLSVFADSDVNVIDMVNKSRDEVAYNILDLAAPPGDGVIDQIRNVQHVISVRVLQPQTF